MSEIQQEILNDTDSKIIIITGRYATENSKIALQKLLTVKTSIAINTKKERKHHVISLVGMTSDDYKLKLAENYFETENSKVMFRTYDDILKLLGVRVDMFLLDNIHLADCNIKLFYNKILARRPKQIIIPCNKYNLQLVEDIINDSKVNLYNSNVNMYNT